MYFVAKTYTVLNADMKADIEKIINGAYSDEVDDEVLENLDSYLNEQIDLDFLKSCSSEEFK